MSSTSTTDEKLFICGQSFAFGNQVCQRDEVVRESSAAYRANPSVFDPLGTPDSERQTAFQGFHDAQEAAERAAVEAAEAEFQRQAAANKITLRAEPPKVLTARHDIATHVNGVPALIARGSTILETDVLAVTDPDAWSPKR